MARIIGIVNAKGGVGKTTTANNLGAYLAARGKYVLLVDLDPQANATAGLGLHLADDHLNLYHLLINGDEPEAIIRKSSLFGFDVLPSAENLAGATVELVDMEEREFKLKHALNKIRTNYDYILIDSPPSLGLLTVNGLVAAEQVIIPVQCEYYALEDLLGPYLEPVLRFNRIDRMHALQGAYIKIPVNLKDAVGFTPMPQKLERAKSYRRYLFLDLSEQFLGAYEFRELKFSLPIASGRGHSTPAGVFKVLGRDRWHRSHRYTITGTNIPYPMFWGVKFYVSKKGAAFWIHSRDVPGYPVSHGCVGLYDEEMQKKFYGYPKNPQLLDSKKLYLWFFPDGGDNDKPRMYPEGLPDALIEIK